MPAEEHRAEGPERIRFAVLTVSDTRTKETDEGGQLVIELIQAAFHAATARALCKDDTAAITALVNDACSREDVDVLVVTGGTGLSKRDTTHDALARAYEVAIPGFGELFRALSFDEIGAAAMLSRASAGIVKGKPVFSLPGSPGAIRLGMTRLVLPEAGHLLAQLAR